MLVQAAAASAQTPASPPGAAPRSLELIVGEPADVSFGSVERFLVGDPAVLDAEQLNPSTLRLTPLAPGKTFVLVWGPEGRRTSVVRVMPFRLGPILPEPAVEEAVKHARALKVGYTFDYETDRRGSTFRDTRLDTTNRFNQQLNTDMETPYGDFTSQFQMQRVNSVEDLTFWQTRLAHGHLGPVDDFDAIAGDSYIPFARGFAVPSVGYRGATLRLDDLGPFHAAGLWGRERSSIYSLSSQGGFGVKRDSFVSGLNVGYEDPANPWQVEASTLFGQGDERQANTSDEMVDLSSAYRVTEVWSLKQELAMSDESFGWTTGSFTHFSKFDFDAIFRDVPDDFNTVTGSPIIQGERGLELRTRWAPLNSLIVLGRTDTYKNRLFPNTEEPDTLNFSTDWSVDWYARPGTDLMAHFNRQRLLGQSFPTDELRASTGVRQRIPLPGESRWIYDPTVSLQLEHVDTRSVSTPSLDVNAEIVSLGMSVPLFWGLTASASHDRHFLTEKLTDEDFRPRRSTVSLSQFATFFDSKLQWRNRIGWEDESRSASQRSFLAGQDRWIGQTGLRWQVQDSTELYVDAQVDKVKFESGEEHQVEVSVMAGGKVIFDTQVIRWDPAAEVEGTVFHDLNSDGTQQPDEPGIPGVKVTAGLSRHAVSDEQGRFVMPRVRGLSTPVGVEISSLPKGYVLSTPGTHVIKPKEKKRVQLAFGASGRSEIRGRIFEDSDGDGKYSSADVGIEGVVVRLQKARAKSDHSGWFFFRDLPGGEQEMSVQLTTLPVYYLPKVPVQQKFQLIEGQTLSVDIPLASNRIIRGQVYEDSNNNGQYDAGEPKIKGLAMCLDGKQVATTDEQGKYQFTNIGRGRHELLLNCGMPLTPYMPLSRREVSVSIDAKTGEALTVDFRLIREETVTKELLKERGGSSGKATPARPSS